jgi:predicted metalloprotease with PDZ domain
MTEIHYRIVPHDPHAHLFRVTLTLSHADPTGQELSLPAWIPGSYMIRDFARNIVWLRAWQGRDEIAVSRIDKSTWKLAPATGPVEVSWEVYAWDLSVRAAHLDQHHAYFNGTSVFLAVKGQESLPCVVDILPPPDGIGTDWRVATTLADAGAGRFGFGRYRAADYDDLIDHPVEIAAFTLGSFEACGVPHDIVITGRHDADLPRVCADLKKICEHEIRFFGEPAPYERYLFIVWAVGDGYGGLEHRSSTSLICMRDDLPTIHQREQLPESYRTFLGLCSHEYFHNWNVKRIKPAVFLPYDLSRETHTSLLWVFEGITSYYDDLMLFRCGLITASDYLQLLGQNITRLLRTPGRLQQCLADSSFDAWTRFYKQDENAVNALVSYYLKGSIVALGLDLLLRDISDHHLTLDTVMRVLWKDFACKQRGLAEQEFESLVLDLVDDVVGADGLAPVRAFFQRAVRETDDIDLAGLLASAGVRMNLRGAASASDKGGMEASVDHSRKARLGGQFARDDAGARIVSLPNGTPAHRAGLSAGDVIIAMNGIRTDASGIERHLGRLAPGDTVIVHAFRRDELLVVTAVLDSVPLDTCWLSVVDEPAMRRWLSGADPV